MKAVRCFFAVTIVAAALLVGASPARADHVADLLTGVDGNVRCRMGGLESGIGVDLWTTNFKVARTGDDTIAAFVCRFADVPVYVSAEDSYNGTEWYQPTNALVNTNVECWIDDFDVFVMGGEGRFVLNPNGTATLTCTF